MLQCKVMQTMRKISRPAKTRPKPSTPDFQIQLLNLVNPPATVHTGTLVQASLLHPKPPLTQHEKGPDLTIPPGDLHPHVVKALWAAGLLKVGELSY